MRSSWIGLTAFAILWLDLEPRSTEFRGSLPASGWYLWLILGALAFLLDGRIRRLHLGVSAPLPTGVLAALLVFVLPFPQCVGGLLLVLGVILPALEKRYPQLRVGLFASACTVSGFSLILSGLLWHWFLPLSARWHDLPLLASPVAAALRPFPLDLATRGPCLLIRFHDTTVPVRVSVENLGLFISCILCLGHLFLASAARHRNLLRAFLTYLLVLAVYLPLRFAFIVLLYLTSQDLSIFASTFILFITFLPIAFAGDFIFGEDSALGSTMPALPPARLAVPTTTAFIAGLLSAFSLYFYDPGLPKPGRVLIDDWNSRWEWTDAPIDRNTFGVRSVYNYTSLADFLRYYYTVQILREPLSPQTLADVDVLILKVPTRPYTDTEIDAVHRFVQAGGGVWLISDHTNIYGMNTYLNQIADRWGIRFNHDATFRIPTGRQAYAAPVENPHPVVQRLGTILFATSDSLSASPSTMSVIVGYGLAASAAEYSQNTFFGDLSYHASDRHGAFLQCAAKHVGAGRVLAFSDSTIFSSFSVFMPGVSELALQSVDWLNRRNCLNSLNLTFALGSGLFLLIALITGLPFRRRTGVLTLALLLGLFSGSRMCTLLTMRVYTPPVPKLSYHTLAFLYDRSNFKLPVFHETHEGDPDSFHTLFVLAQRVGLVPHVAFSVDSGVLSDTMVVIRPMESLGKDSLRQIENYVTRGGRLIVFGGVGASADAVDEILKAFGMVWRLTSDQCTVKLPGQTGPITDIAVRGTVFNGNEIAGSQDQHSLIAMTHFGGGRVLAVSDANLFSDVALGPNWGVPEGERAVMTLLAFRLYDLTGLTAPDARIQSPIIDCTASSMAGP